MIRLLTDREIVKFLQMIKQGHNTYGELQKRFHIDDHTWVLFIENDVFLNPPPENRKHNIIAFVSAPESYSWDYDFKDTDSFRVTVAGQNILDRESRDFWLRFFTAVAAFGSIAAVIIGVMQILRC